MDSEFLSIDSLSTVSFLTASGLAGLTLLVSWTCAQMFYSAYMHPLCRYPGPKLWAASRLPWCWHQYNGSLHERILELHTQYGPTVRVAPHELTYTTETAWKTIYGQRPVEMGKDPIFSVSNPSTVRNIMNADRPGHGRQRRLLSYAFSDRALREQERILLTHVDKLMEKLSTRCSSGPMNMVAWLNFITYDIIGDLSFGEEFGCIEKGDYDDFVRSITNGTTEMMFSQIMRYYKISGLYQLLMPKAVAGTRARNLKRALSTVERRINRDTDRKDFLHYILAADEEKGMSRAEIHVNAFALLVAGSETTASWVSGILFYILHNRDIYRRLVDEIRNAFESQDEIRLSSVTNLQYLDAVTTEALRMYPPVPTVLPRSVPPGGEVIDGQYVPAGTTVGVHHYATYKSPRNFHRADEFIPERWLPGQRDSSPFDKDNRACLQAFSYGPRNCLGKNLAIAEVRLIMARLFWHFNLEFSEAQEGWKRDQLACGLWLKPPLFCNLSPDVRGRSEECKMSSG